MGKLNSGKEEPTTNYYEKLDRRFDEVWASASSTFRINRRINVIVVGIGISLIAYGLIFQWYDTFVYNPSTASISNTSDEQANVTSKNSNSEDQQDIPNLTGLISSGTGLATIIGLFFFKSQAHIQRAFTNLALTNMISTANSYNFQRLDWYLWWKYMYPIMNQIDRTIPKTDTSFLKDIKVSDFTDILNPMRDVTKEYSAELYEKTRLMEELEDEGEDEDEKEKVKDDKVSNGKDGNKTDATSGK